MRRAKTKVPPESVLAMVLRGEHGMHCGMACEL
jgi:hypothetical protein